MKEAERIELLERIIETIAEGIVVINHEGRVVFVNKAAEKILGLGKTNIMGRPCKDLWKNTAERDSSSEELFTRVIQEGKPAYGFKYSYDRSDSTKVIVSIDAAPIYDAKGSIEGVVLSIRDLRGKEGIL